MKRLLIVENDPESLFLVRACLKDSGFEVVGTAATGAEALDLAAALSPDLVLMDILLEGSMSGIEAAARLRMFSSASVVFMTAYSSQSELVENAKLARPSGYVEKPYTRRILLETLEKAASYLETDSTVGTPSDHDLLVRLDTKLDLVSIQLNEARVQMTLKADSTRVDKIERVVDGMADSTRVDKIERVVDGIQSKVLMATGALAALQFLLHTLWK